MIGSASTALTPPMAGAPGAMASGRASGDGGTKGFGAIVASLGAAPGIGGGGDAGGETQAGPPAIVPMSEAADGEDVSEILDVVAIVSASRKAATAAEGMTDAADVPEATAEGEKVPQKAGDATGEDEVIADALSSDAADAKPPVAVRLMAMLMRVNRATGSAGGNVPPAMSDEAALTVVKAAGTAGGEEGAEADDDGKDAGAGDGADPAAPAVAASPAPSNLVIPAAVIPTASSPPVTEGGEAADAAVRSGPSVRLPKPGPASPPAARHAESDRQAMTFALPEDGAEPVDPMPAGPLSAGEEASVVAATVDLPEPQPAKAESPAGERDQPPARAVTAQRLPGVAMPPAEPGQEQAIRVAGDPAGFLLPAAAEKAGSGEDSAAPAPAPAPAGAAIAAQPVPDQVAPVAVPAPSQAVDVAMASPAMSAEQAVMGHHLDLARDSAWLDQLARDIAATAGGDSKLQFKLNPEHLGSLHVEVIRHDDGASVRMTTESEAARSMLSDAQGRLVAEARHHGMRITETNVDLGRNGGGGDNGQRAWGDAQSGQQNSQAQHRHVNASVTTKTVNGDRTEAPTARQERYA